MSQSQSINGLFLISQSLRITLWMHWLLLINICFYHTLKCCSQSSKYIYFSKHLLLCLLVNTFFCTPWETKMEHFQLFYSIKLLFMARKCSSTIRLIIYILISLTAFHQHPTFLFVNCNGLFSVWIWLKNTNIGGIIHTTSGLKLPNMT